MMALPPILINAILQTYLDDFRIFLFQAEASHVQWANRREHDQWDSHRASPDLWVSQWAALRVSHVHRACLLAASQVSPDQWASPLAVSLGPWASHLVACLLAVPDRASPERDQWVSHPVVCHLVHDLVVLLLTAALATCSATLFRGTSEQRCHEWVNPSKRAGPLSDQDWVMIKLLG